MPDGLEVEYHRALAHEILLAAAEKVEVEGGGQFDIKRDNALIAAGTHFWCHTHMMAIPADGRSLDPRYCQNCCDFLLGEASLLPIKMRPAWIPKIRDKKVLPISGDGMRIMSTINDNKIPSGHISPAAPPQRHIGKRGPKFRDDIPVDRVHELAAQGKGPKAIAGELKGEGVTVSYKTIQRILDGQRVMV